MERAGSGLGGFGRGNGIIGGGDSCRKCNQRGHFARECPNDGIRTGGVGNTVPQYQGDQQFGHGNGSDEREAREQRPAVTYQPTEARLDELWGQHIAPGVNFNRFFDPNVKVEVSGEDPIIRPIRTFEEAGLTPVLLKNVRQCGYTKPTPIQQYAIPYIARGKDVIACAQTGSGKTAAYLLPVLASMLQREDMNGMLNFHQEPVAIILTPTRELAVQVKDEARKFANGTMVSVAVIYGGTNVRTQVENLYRGCNILVATPGRLMQFIDEGRIFLRKCRYLILDEADRMLDMGFEPTIRRLVELPEMPPKGELRQTLMFSATFPPEIQTLAQDYMHQYAFLTIGIRGGANEDIVQEILPISGHDKYEKLYSLITENLEKAKAAGQTNLMKTLVFVERRRVADFVASKLSQMEFPTTSIHGDREQREREEALRDFKTGRCPVLVATAVAARGLDIIHVDHVINFDLPASIDDYVHRIGRTGRVGNPGRATSFYDSRIDRQLAPDLLKVLRDAQQEVPDWFLEEAGTDVASGTTNDGGAVKAGYSGGADNEEVW